MPEQANDQSPDETALEQANEELRAKVAAMLGSFSSGEPKDPFLEDAIDRIYRAATSTNEADPATQTPPKTTDAEPSA